MLVFCTSSYVIFRLAQLMLLENILLNQFITVFFDSNIAHNMHHALKYAILRPYQCNCQTQLNILKINLSASKPLQWSVDGNEVGCFYCLMRYWGDGCV